MRKYIKRIFLALALAGALAAATQPLYALDIKTLRNNQRVVQSEEEFARQAYWFLWLFGFRFGEHVAPPTTPPENNDFAAPEPGKKERSGEEVQKALE